MRKILGSLMTLGILVGVVYGSTTAFFSDTETSGNNKLQAGRLDLKINSQDNPEALVNIEDLKPGDDYTPSPPGCFVFTPWEITFYI